MDIDTVFALIVGLGAIPLGFWTFWSAMKNKASFMEAGKAKEIAMFLGRTGARIFYMLCGLLLIGIGMLLLLALLGIVKLPKSSSSDLPRIPCSMASILSPAPMPLKECFPCLSHTGHRTASKNLTIKGL